MSKDYLIWPLLSGRGWRPTLFANATGVVIGHTNLPLVNEGDALFHIATFDRLTSVEEQILACARAVKAAVLSALRRDGAPRICRPGSGYAGGGEPRNTSRRIHAT